MPTRAGAIAVVFAANGLAGPSFLARLPERQAALDLSDGTLGMVLVGLALGALVASPVAGRLTNAVGSRTLAVGAAVALGGCLWLAGAAPNAGSLFAALAVIGAVDAAMDIAMNANGAIYEDRTSRSVMHRLHAAWSFGALAAAGLAALAATTEVPLTVHLAVVGALLAAACLFARPALAPTEPPEAPVSPGPAPAPTPRARLHDQPADQAAPVPTAPAGTDQADPADQAGTDQTGLADQAGTGSSGRVVTAMVVLATATVAGAVIEGAPTDWSAILLQRYGTTEGVAALGVAAFTAGMVAGRLAGDWLTDRLGGARMLRLGGTLVAAGLTLGAATGHAGAFLVGLVVAGVGAAGFFPLAFSAAVRTPGVSAGAGAATVSLAARLGFLAEPVLLGAVSEAVGLRWAFGLVAGTAVLLAVTAGLIIPPNGGSGSAALRPPPPAADGVHAP
ncbi:MAG TPA: MFS transporter [Acidimicrobiales bacterium]